MALHLQYARAKNRAIQLPWQDVVKEVGLFSLPEDIGQVLHGQEG